MTIMIVDDAAITRSILRMILEKIGHRVIDTDSVGGALEIFRNEHPELVFLDLNLSGESGMLVFAELGAQHLDVPFILMTASNDEREFKSAKAAGIREIIQKPFKPDAILKLIEKHKPKGAAQRLLPVTLNLESRILDKARALAAQQSDKTPEDVLEEFLHRAFAEPVEAAAAQ